MITGRIGDEHFVPGRVSTSCRTTPARGTITLSTGGVVTGTVVGVHRDYVALLADPECADVLGWGSGHDEVGTPAERYALRLLEAAEVAGNVLADADLSNREDPTAQLGTLPPRLARELARGPRIDGSVALRSGVAQAGGTVLSPRDQRWGGAGRDPVAPVDESARGSARARRWAGRAGLTCVIALPSRGRRRSQLPISSRICSATAAWRAGCSFATCSSSALRATHTSRSSSAVPASMMGSR